MEYAISLHKAGDNIRADVVKRVPVNFLRPIKGAAGNVEDDLNIYVNQQWRQCQANGFGGRARGPRAGPGIGITE